MKRVGLLVLFVLGLAAAGGLSAGVVGASTTTGTTTTTEPTTIASGVTISGVEVGDLTYDEAFAAVRDSFARPVTLVVPRHRLAIEPARIGAMAYVRASVNRALTVPAGTALKLRVILNRKGTQRYLDAVAKRFDREAVDSELLLRNLRPVITKEQAGRTLREVRAMNGIFTALVTNTRPEVALQFAELKPSVTRGSFGPVIVIRRGSNRLYLYKGMRFQRVLRRRHRPVGLPDPARELARRRQVAEPVVVPAELAVGEGREAGSAGAGEPARHALDGPVGERRRHPRHA